MRNRRLLTLAVLAVALGFAPFAQAETAVVTVVENGTNVDIRYSISGGTDLGSAASTPGALDIVLKSITALDTATFGTVGIVAPQGTVEDQGSLATAFAGFSGEATADSIRNLTLDPNTGAYNVTLLQPAAYDDPSDGLDWTAVQDEAVLKGIGTTGSAGANASLPNNNVDWEDPLTAPTWDGDTKIVSATLGATAGTGYSVGVTTYGADSFSVLAPDSNSRWTGPADANMYIDNPPVQATVIINTYDPNGVGGGTIVPTTATTLTVETGDVTLGSSFASGTQNIGGGTTVANLTVVVPASTSVTLGANHVLSDLDIDPNGSVDVDQYTVALYNGNEATVLGDILDGDLTSSDTRVGSGMSIGFAAKTDDSALPYLLVGLAKTGDTNMDGAIDGADQANLSVFWDPAGASGETKWYNGDLNLDGAIDGADQALISVWWNPAGDPIPFAAAVPEPATLGLLALGAIGLIRRRRA